MENGEENSWKWMMIPIFISSSICDALSFASRLPTRSILENIQTICIYSGRIEIDSLNFITRIQCVNSHYTVPKYKKYFFCYFIGTSTSSNGND